MCVCMCACACVCAAACVLELLKVMLGSDLPALLTVLVEWLRPETNCSADVRLAAINGESTAHPNTTPTTCLGKHTYTSYIARAW